jgi:hypothetical protein
MTKKKLNMTDIQDFLAYKVENDKETDAEYELYLAIIEEESNIKERYSKLLKQLVKQIREYEDFGS